jgi:hydrogenase maturation protease
MNTIHTLVIACGNPLRGDDALGRAAAEIMQSWQTPGVKVLSVHQLVPELIDEMKPVQRVLFIDAGFPTNDQAFEACVVEPKKSRRSLGHHETPANLMAVLRELEGQAPKAWLMSISSLTFDHADEISEGAQVHLQAALAWVRAFLAEPLN